MARQVTINGRRFDTFLKDWEFDAVRRTMIRAVGYKIDDVEVSPERWEREMQRALARCSTGGGDE